MKKINLIVLLVLAAAVLWARPAGAQNATPPFNTINPANPNVMIFMDNSGNLSTNFPDDPDGRSTFQVVTDVMAGRQVPIYFPANSTTPVYQPHYDITNQGTYWVFDRVVGNVITSNYYETQAMPRVVRLRKDAQGWYEPSTGGNFFLFLHVTDATRATALLAGSSTAPTVTNLAQFFRAAEPQGAALNPSVRWANYYTIRETTVGEVHFSATDTVNNRAIWRVSDTPSGVAGTDYLTYNEALKKYYGYETTGAEAGGADARVIVPLKYVPANVSAGWTSPSDGLAKVGLCYIRRVGTPKTDVAYDCYKPTTINDPLANRFLVLSETAYGTAAEQLNLNQTTLTAWRAARAAAGDATSANAVFYCQNTTKEVWGDAPYANWTWANKDQPKWDDMSSAPVPIYGATIAGANCQSSDPAAFAYGEVAPTDAKIKTDLDTALFRVQGVDASVPYGDTIDEFVLPAVAGANPRVDTFLKTALESTANHNWWCLQIKLFQSTYLCPTPVPTWPGSISFDDPWYGGFYDHLYWDRSDRGSPGIMQSFQDVNYGFAGYELQNVSAANCPGIDFAADSEGNCNGADIIMNIASYGEFKAYNSYYPVSVINRNIREAIIAANGGNHGNSPIASSFHALWRYFYNVDTTSHSHTANLYSSDTQMVSGGLNTMFFDLGFPDPWNSAGTTKRHLIQCDPFYKNGCRRNYIIYLSGGRDRNGEVMYNLADEGWGNRFFPSSITINKDGLAANDTTLNLSSLNASTQRVYAALGKWIWALKDPEFINAYDFDGDFTTRNLQPSSQGDQSSGTCRHVKNVSSIPYGVKTFFIGFPTNDGDAEQLGYMAWASRMKSVEEDPAEIDYWMSAESEDALRAKLTIVMNAIMGGQFARAAPEISQLEGSIITTYFTVGSGYLLYQGHLLKWDLAQIQGGSTAGADWDFATRLKEQSKSGTRNIWTMLGNTRFQFWGASPSAELIDAFNPNNVNWGGTIENAEAAGLIDFINGDPDATISGGKIASWLGPIYHSKPLIVGPPSTLSYQSFPDYGAFVDAHAARPSLIYVGTGHGMLHAIALDSGSGLTSGQEVYAFVPPGVLRYMPQLRKGVQTYGVDGSPVVRDAIFYPPIHNPDGTPKMDWRTVLMVGLAGGGTSYSVLDITGVTNDGADADLIGSFRDTNLAMTYSVPVIAPVTTKNSSNEVLTKWAAFFGGGRQVDQDALEPNKGNYFYIMNLQTATAFQKFFVPDITQVVTLKGDSTIPHYTYNTGGVNKNQVAGTPLLIDKDGDRDYDFAYFGDMEGRLWKANFSGTLLEGSTPGDSPWEICPFYDMADENFNGVIDSTEDIPMSRRMPVYYTPDATRTPDNKLLIYFSTGNAEWTKVGDTITNKIYALVDPQTTGCDYGQTLPVTINGENVLWPITLDPGEKPLTPIHIIGGKAIFKTFLPTVTIACSPGTTRLWTLNYLTGAAYVPNQPYVETNEDGEAIGTTDISFDIGIGGGSNAAGEPETFDIPILPADPLSWGEGVTFD